MDRFEPKARCADVSVLLVDDEGPVRTCLSLLFRRAGVDHAVAASAKEALTVCEERMPSIVITDIVMPEMDGVALALALRRRYPDLCVFAFTGNAGNVPSDDIGVLFDQVYLKPEDYSRLVKESVNVLEQTELEPACA